MSADRIFVACGGIGTTRLVMGSLGLFNQTVELGESVQVVMPAISKTPTRSDPRNERDFTLNQFNLVYDASGDGFDLARSISIPTIRYSRPRYPRPLQHTCEAAGHGPTPSDIRWARLHTFLGFAQGEGERRISVQTESSRSW